ncbi:MAG: hypothetical protein ACOYMN_11000 [Roseimicrobium sp.]
MKLHALLATALAAFSLTAGAETTITLTDLHNCCQGCERGIVNALESVDGVKVAMDKTSATLTAKNQGDADKAMAKLLDAGYYGKGMPVLSVPDKKVQSATVSGTHLCCGKCVKGVDAAIKDTAGATKHSAVKGAKTFTVEGNFNLKDLLAALHKHGYHGKIE